MKNSVLIAVSKVADKPHYMVRSALLNTLLKRSGTRDMKVSVISVFGDGWTLLKLLKSYAKHRYKDGGPENVEWWSMKDETEGEPGFIKTIVRIMPEIIIADTQASGKIAIVIVGSPLNEPYSLEEEAIAFSINALSSSCLIFPTDRNISGNNLDRLNLLAAYSRQVHKSQDDYKSFQKLLFLVKDWDSPSRFEFGLKGGQQYLIESVFHHSEKSVDQLKICQNLKMSFEEMECVLMSNPHPRRSRGLLRKSLNTRDQLEKEYLDQAKQLVQHVLSPENLCKKRINGASIGERLFLAPTHTEVEKYVNGSYIITCGAPYASNLSWTGPKGQVINATEGKNLHIQDRDGHYLSLVFEVIEKSHRGNYTCKGYSDKVHQSLTFSLIVVKPITFAGPLDTQKAIVQNATEFKPVTVKCEVSGDPQPKVVWQFKGKALPTGLQGDRLLPMVHGLYIKNVSYEDEGVYQCRAFQVTKLTSSMESRQITLTVQHKPRWVPINNSEQDRAYGYSKGVANITCRASARPRADYSWTRLNGTLDNTTTNVIDEVDRSVLQVNMVDKSVLGPYECTANNSLGEIRKVVELVEGNKPSPPIRVSVVGRGVYSAQFHLHAVSKEQVIGYRIQFIKRTQRDSIENGDYQDVYTSDGVPYSIYNLEENTEYSYRVATRNNAGLSDYSPIQTFRTRDRFTNRAHNLFSSSLLSHFGLLLPFLIQRTM